MHREYFKTSQTSIDEYAQGRVIYDWGIDFTGHFPPSFSQVYIILVVDYVSKWVEAIPTRTNDAKVVLTFLQKTSSLCLVR